MRIARTIVSTLLVILFIGLASSAEPNKSEGRRTVEKLGCVHCHIIEGRGGTVAPPLDGIAAFRDKAYITNRLQGKDIPGYKEYPLPEEMMKHIHVRAQDVEQIADYLMTLKKTQFSVTGHGHLPENVPSGSQFQPLPQSESSKVGAQMSKDLGCMACHAVGPIGGTIGPNFAGVGARRSQNYIKDRILNGAILLPPPGAPSGKYVMQPHELCEPHLKELMDFLLTLPPEPRRKVQNQSTPHKKQSTR